MTKTTIMLRLSYWLAAIADFAVAGLVLIPARMGVSEPVYPMGLMASVAFCWGVLLLIADRKPVERRWVLPPTILVIGFLSLTRIIFYMKGVVEFSLGFLLIGVFLKLLLGYCYCLAGRTEENEQTQTPLVVPGPELK